MGAEHVGDIVVSHQDLCPKIENVRLIRIAAACLFAFHSVVHGQCLRRVSTTPRPADD
jgi:hypothetical protein